MASPLRVEFSGACYHVINRGNFCFLIFREERDRELILAKLVVFSEHFQVRVRAYCVQIKHFHLSNRGLPKTYGIHPEFPRM